MRIPEEALNEFIELYEEEFGEKIDRTEATGMAHSLLALCRLLARKPPVRPTADGGRAKPQCEKHRAPHERQTSFPAS